MSTPTRTGFATRTQALPVSQAGLARVGLLAVQALVAVTALAGGLALIVGSLVPRLAPLLTPSTAFLEGSPFLGYLIPGLMLAGVIGGLHLAALVLNLRRHRWAVFAGAVAGFAMLIWVFVQMVFIPFSFLQAIYFAAGVAEIGLVMLALGITRPDR